MGNYIFTEDDHSSDGSSSSSSNSSGAQSGSQSIDFQVSSDSSHNSTSSSSGDDSSSSSTHISQHTFESNDGDSSSTTNFSSDTWESSQSSRDAEDESSNWSRITEHAVDTDGPSSNSVAGTQDSSADSAAGNNEEQSPTTPSSYDHNAAAQDKIASQIDDYEDGWPVNDNGEYLVIDVTIRPQADIDLTTIFGLTADANGPDNAVDFDTLVEQLAKVSEDTYIEIDYRWGAKPDLIVTLEPDFNIDSDVFARVNHDADDVTLDTLLDIIQTAIPTSDASVFVDFDPDDSDHDGHAFDIDVDVDLSVLVDQGLDAQVDATLPH